MCLNTIPATPLFISSVLLGLSLYFGPEVLQCGGHLMTLSDELDDVINSSPTPSYPNYQTLQNETQNLKLYTAQILQTLKTLTSCQNTDALNLLNQLNLSKFHDNFQKEINILQQIQNLATVTKSIVEITTNLKTIKTNKNLIAKPKEFDKITELGAKLVAKIHEINNGMSTLNKDNPLYINANSCPEINIETKEATGILNTRDQSREAIYFVDYAGTGIIESTLICALESTARAHPAGDVYLLMAFLPDSGLLIEKNNPLNHVLKRQKNIRILTVDFVKLFQLSPLKHLSTFKFTKESFKNQIKEVVQTLISTIYGGFFLDKKVMVMKNQTDIKNFIIFEKIKTVILHAAFKFQKNHPIMNGLLQWVNSTFSTPIVENYYLAFTREVMKYAEVNDTKNVTAFNLKDVKLLDAGSLIPYDAYEVQILFDPLQFPTVLPHLRGLKGLWGVYVGMEGVVVGIGTTQSYGLLAQQYCPRTYWAYRDKFIG